jgi:phosphomannomutase
MADDLNLSMFRAYDIRTPSEDLTPQLAERLARAEARYFQETLGVKGVVVAHDARSTGPQYLTIGTEAFLQAGLDVLYLPGATSTSHFYFTAMQHPDYAAVMFGASHNPAGDTGQKMLGPGVRPIAEHIGPEGGLDQVKDLYIEGASASSTSRGAMTPLDNLQEYIAYSMDLAGVEPGSLARVPIFHDYLFGAGGREMLLAFHRAGASLGSLHFTPDGRFPLGDPNPVKGPVVRKGLETLKRGGFLLGTFFDGDADRIDFYAGDGRYLSSSFVYAGILPYITARFPGREVGVFADLKSNPLAVIEMAKAGVTVNVIRNGHSQIKDAMFEDHRMIGTVEESAHFYESFYLDGNGPYATENTLYIALLTTRAWQENPARFERLFDLQSRTQREREWGHYFPTDADRANALDAVQAHFESLGAKAMRKMSNGLDLEATLMRRGLPFDIRQDTELASDWLQVCQRISQSENGLARWEVVAATQEIAAQAKADILRITAEHGGSEPYIG